MIDFPWRGDRDEADSRGTADAVDEDRHAEAVVVCEFQDGTLAVYEERVVIDRPARSSFDDTTVPVDEITGVDFDGGITIGYLQLELAGVAPDAGGLLSDPVNERTLHFGWNDKGCAKRARDAILERARG
ncbi:hypothetical protein C2R22_04465 [Salinigranum rubrum]|uniref:Uncharacterized protein n=1 Tax=Salinigranum rubrum TaxID=755307 RepID=A0A2I8VGJ0_9EURY|nr:hypothetical protein [Salinigranum rubrum]AUV81004.1 hypothetical protein C2R22_04465 [Salinigranum rubrum]